MQSLQQCQDKPVSSKSPNKPECNINLRYVVLRVKGMTFSLLKKTSFSSTLLFCCDATNINRLMEGIAEKNNVTRRPVVTLIALTVELTNA